MLASQETFLKQIVVSKKRLPPHFIKQKAIAR
jgi:hypothetical protein